MATETQYLDIGSYRWTSTTVNGRIVTQILEWSGDGKLVPTTNKEFMEDMWEQWKLDRARAKEHNDALASEWESWTFRKNTGWNGWENPWPEGDFIKVEYPKDARTRFLSTPPIPDWKDLQQGSPISEQRKWPEHDASGKPIFCEDLVDNGNCKCGRCF